MESGFPGVVMCEQRAIVPEPPGTFIRDRAGRVVISERFRERWLYQGWGMSFRRRVQASELAQQQ